MADNGLDLSNVPDELIYALADAGLIDDRQAMIMVQMRQANKLRDTPTPQATQQLGQDEFGTIIAPTNPAEYIFASMDQNKGEAQQKELTAKYYELLNNYGKTAGDWMMTQKKKQALPQRNGWLPGWSPDGDTNAGP